MILNSLIFQLNSPEEGLNRADSILVDTKEDHRVSVAVLDEEVNVMFPTAYIQPPV